MMALSRSKIHNRLARQRAMEGDSPDLDLLDVVAGMVKTSQEWSALTKVRYERYGTLSYEVHIFYSPSPLLRALLALTT